MKNALPLAFWLVFPPLPWGGVAYWAGFSALPITAVCLFASFVGFCTFAMLQAGAKSDEIYMEKTNVDL